MTSYVAVLPFVHRPYRDEFMKTCKLDVFEVDNTVNNIGIMRAHNLGVDEMRKQNADWLIVIGASIRFGEKGGLDFLEALEQRPNDHVVECAGVYGWHLIAFNKKTIEKVGKWDANFSPYGFCDLDMSLRIQKAFRKEGKYPLWEKADGIDVTDTGMSHGMKLTDKVDAPADPRIAYFKKKWGRHPGEYEKESFATPFNDPKNSVAYWPEYEGSKWNE